MTIKTSLRYLILPSILAGAFLLTFFSFTATVEAATATGHTTYLGWCGPSAIACMEATSFTAWGTANGPSTVAPGATMTISGTAWCGGDDASGFREMRVRIGSYTFPSTYSNHCPSGEEGSVGSVNITAPMTPGIYNLNVYVLVVGDTPNHLVQPAVQGVYTYTVVAPPAITVTPVGLNFGDTEVGTTRDRTFVVSNTGGGTLNINASPSITGSFGARYTCVSASCSSAQAITGGNSVSYTVRYSPTTVSNGQTADLALSVTFSQNVSLTGNGVAFPPPLPTASFTSPSVEPTINTINSGDSVTLTWTSSNADSCEIRESSGGTGIVWSLLGPFDSLVVSPTVDTSYKVRCQNATGESEASPNVVVTVNALPPPPPPPIGSCSTLSCGIVLAPFGCDSTVVTGAIVPSGSDAIAECSARGYNNSCNTPTYSALDGPVACTPPPPPPIGSCSQLFCGFGTDACGDTDMGGGVFVPASTNPVAECTSLGYTTVCNQPTFSYLGAGGACTAAATYSVAYNAGLATSGTAPGGQTKTQDVTLTLRNNTGTLARTGYTYAGWNTASDGSGATYNEGGSYTANSAVTLYPRWTMAPVDLAASTPSVTNGAPLNSGIDGTYNVQASFRIRNVGMGEILAGSDISYKAVLNGTTQSAVGTFNGSIASSSQSSLLPPRTFNNVRFGDYNVCSVVNMDPVRLGESASDLANNTSNPCRNFNLPMPRPPMNISSNNQFIRAGESVDITWRAHTSYPLTCTVSGPGGISDSFDASSQNSIDGTAYINSGIAGPLNNTGTFRLLCVASTGESQEASVTVEVIPDYQET